jgi:hypothetical protein
MNDVPTIIAVSFIFTILLCRIPWGIRKFLIIELLSWMLGHIFSSFLSYHYPSVTLGRKLLYFEVTIFNWCKVSSGVLDCRGFLFRYPMRFYIKVIWRFSSIDMSVWEKWVWIFVPCIWPDWEICWAIFLNLRRKGMFLDKLLLGRWEISLKREGLGVITATTILFSAKVKVLYHLVIVVTLRTKYETMGMLGLMLAGLWDMLQIPSVQLCSLEHCFGRLIRRCTQ